MFSDEYPYAGVSVIFQFFLHRFVSVKLATSIIRVKANHNKSLLSPPLFLLAASRASMRSYHWSTLALVRFTHVSRSWHYLSVEWTSEEDHVIARALQPRGSITLSATSINGIGTRLLKGGLCLIESLSVSILAVSEHCSMCNKTKGGLTTCRLPFNRSNAEAIFVQNTRTQRILKTI